MSTIQQNHASSTSTPKRPLLWSSLEMIKAQGGIFGWVSNAHSFIKAVA